MTKAEASRHLNAILSAVDALRQDCQRSPRLEGRLDVVVDHVMLLALDLRLPLKPTEGKANVEPDGG